MTKTTTKPNGSVETSKLVYGPLEKIIIAVIMLTLPLAGTTVVTSRLNSNDISSMQKDIEEVRHWQGDFDMSDRYTGAEAEADWDRQFDLNASMMSAIADMRVAVATDQSSLRHISGDITEIKEQLRRLLDRLDKNETGGTQ